VKRRRLLWILVITMGIVQKDEPEIPMYFDLPFQVGESFSRSIVGELMEDDFFAPITIELVSDKESPKFYTSDIKTTVCDDEICEIMYIKLYWDLVGEYVGYDTVSHHPLTKFDHEPFTKTDYARLHELLQNEGSILKFKKKEELIDKEKVKASDVVDGTTGATALEIKEEVVEGALYSSYTLWHLAYNGKIKNRLTGKTQSLLDKKLIKYLLNSNRTGYKLFAFQNFQEDDYITYKEYWLSSLENDIPLTRKYIIKNLPERIWTTASVQEAVCKMFTSYDVNTRTYLLNKLEETVQLSSKALEYISNDLTQMNRNQFRHYLDILSKRDTLTELTLANIRKAADDKSFKYAYLIEDYEWIN